MRAEQLNKWDKSNDKAETSKEENLKTVWFKRKAIIFQYNTVNDQYVCFYMDTQLRTFDDARKNCQAAGADLASLQTLWEQAFLTSYVKDNLVWLGMQLNQVTFNCYSTQFKFVIVLHSFFGYLIFKILLW